MHVCPGGLKQPWTCNLKKPVTALHVVSCRLPCVVYWGVCCVCCVPVTAPCSCLSIVPQRCSTSHSHTSPTSHYHLFRHIAHLPTLRHIALLPSYRHIALLSASQPHRTPTRTSDPALGRFTRPPALCPPSGDRASTPLITPYELVTMKPTTDNPCLTYFVRVWLPGWCSPL